MVVTFWGRPQRRTSKLWIHQCGSVEEALAARAAGADAVIAQGVEAGGHVRGTCPAAGAARPSPRRGPNDYPVLSAGGIADAADVSARLDAGAEAVVCGTRFLMTRRAAPTPAYKAAPARGARDDPHRALRRRLARARTASSRTRPPPAGWGVIRAAPAGCAHSTRRPRRSSPGRRCRCSFAWRRRRTRAGRCSARPRRSPADRRTWSRRDRSTRGSASSASATSAPQASSSVELTPLGNGRERSATFP